MLPQVYPILIPQMDWTKLLSLGQSYLGRNLASSLDLSGMKPGSLSAHISILEAVSGREIQPQKALGLALSSLRHISFGFLILAEQEIVLEFMVFAANNLAFTVSPSRDFLIATGTLESWKWLMVAEPSFVIQSLLNQCRAYFDQAGLRNLLVK